MKWDVGEADLEARVQWKEAGLRENSPVLTFKILSCTFKPSSFEAGPPSATLETTIPPPSELLLPTW